MDEQTFLLGLHAQIEVEQMEERHRRFDPHKRPVTPIGLALVRHVVELVQVAEKRTRKRKAADQAVFEAAIGALVCDQASAVIAGKLEPARLELSKQALSAGNRRADFMTEKFPDTVRALCHESLGLFVLNAARPGKYEKLQSTIFACSAFIALIDELQVTAGDIMKFPDPVELRGCKIGKWVRGQFLERAERLKWPDTGEAKAIREQMMKINAWLASAEFDLYADPERPVSLSQRSLKRIFNDGSLDRGGRIYGGFWQAMRAKDRLDCICLNDENVVGLDFGQTSIRMAYAEVGVEPPEGDLYTIPTIFTRGETLWSNYRDEVKAIMNAMLAADEELIRFPQGSRGRIPKHIKFARLTADIYRHHAPIVDLFGSGRGLKTMKTESDVLIDVLLRLKDLKIHALPVHDCIYVAESHKAIAKEVMESSFLKIVGAPGYVSIEA